MVAVAADPLFLLGGATNDVRRSNVVQASSGSLTTKSACGMSIELNSLG